MRNCRTTHRLSREPSAVRPAITLSALACPAAAYQSTSPASSSMARRTPRTSTRLMQRRSSTCRARQAIRRGSLACLSTIVSTDYPVTLGRRHWARLFFRPSRVERNWHPYSDSLSWNIPACNCAPDGPGLSLHLYGVLTKCLPPHSIAVATATSSVPTVRR